MSAGCGQGLLQETTVSPESVDFASRRLYSILENLFFGVPQMGHLSGASPTNVLPQTLQTEIGASGKSLPDFRVLRASV